MITSVNNTRIKKVAALSQKARERRQEKLYIVEGIKMFLEAPEDEIVEIYISENLDSPACTEKIERLCRKPETSSDRRSDAAARALPYCETVTEEVFRKMSDTQTPQGILCVMRMKEYSIDRMLSAPAPFLMILEDLQDPGNLGTILRTGEGAGINGVILSRESADIYNPKTIRSTMGSIYRIPFVYVSSIKEALQQLQQKNVRTYAAHLAGKLWYDEADYTGGTAFLIGNEGNGLKKETADLADTYIKIPMEGKVESLNAAMASGILMYEVSRQRRK